MWSSEINRMAAIGGAGLLCVPTPDDAPPFSRSADRPLFAVRLGKRSRPASPLPLPAWYLARGRTSFRVGAFCMSAAGCLALLSLRDFMRVVSMTGAISARGRRAGRQMSGWDCHGQTRLKREPDLIGVPLCCGPTKERHSGLAVGAIAPVQRGKVSYATLPCARRTPA